MFRRRQVGLSAADVQAVGEIVVEVAALAAEVKGLKAENKALREDRDTWKQLALKLSCQPPQPVGAQDKT